MHDLTLSVSIDISQFLASYEMLSEDDKRIVRRNPNWYFDTKCSNSQDGNEIMLITNENWKFQG